MCEQQHPGLQMRMGEWKRLVEIHKPIALTHLAVSTWLNTLVGTEPRRQGCPDEFGDRGA
eukprot:1170018-Karenia_brevis.AAC.1